MRRTCQGSLPRKAPGTQTARNKLLSAAVAASPLSPCNMRAAENMPLQIDHSNSSAQFHTVLKTFNIINKREPEITLTALRVRIMTKVYRLPGVCRIRISVDTLETSGYLLLPGTFSGYLQITLTA